MSHLKTIQALLTGLFFAFSSAGAALAQQQQGDAPAEGQALEEALATIHAINQLESQVALMAINHARADQVREYATEVAEDHERLDRKLMVLAHQLDVEVAASRQVQESLQSLQQELGQELQALVQAEGAQFDQAFVGLMVSSHETAIAQVEEMRGKAQFRSGEARAYIARTLSTYKKHLNEARELQEKLQEQARQP